MAKAINRRITICSTNNHRQRKRWNGALARMSSIASCHRRWLETGVRAAAELQEPKQQQGRQNRGRQQQSGNWRKEVHRSNPPRRSNSNNTSSGSRDVSSSTNRPPARRTSDSSRERSEFNLERYACSKLRLTVTSTPPSCSTSSRRRSPARPLAPGSNSSGQRVRAPTSPNHWTPHAAPRPRPLPRNSRTGESRPPTALSASRHTSPPSRKIRSPIGPRVQKPT